MAPSLLAPLPPVRSLATAASYELTVEPYLNALQQLPDSLWVALTSKAPLNAVAMLYAQTNPLVSTVGIAFATMPIFFVASEINRNWSQVDRVWSILPILFHANFAIWNHITGAANQLFTRVDLATSVIAFWGLRLTFNYWRRGGYQIGMEDYRWEILQKNLGSFGFFLLNVTFISTTQVLLLASIAFPMYPMLLSERATGLAPTNLDFAFAGIVALLVTTTAVADQQQWVYHKAKHAYQATGKSQPGYTNGDLSQGFLTRGLWAYSRHPNFTCEQSVWVTMYLWSCATTGTPYNWSGVGALGYLLLFQGSTQFTEQVTKSKYPLYTEYQRQVSKFIPIPGCTWDATKVPTSKKEAKKIK